MSGGRAPKWEVAWCPEQRRWYYQDRVQGKSCWLKPKDCDIELPVGGPAPIKGDPPAMPEDVPPGWQAVLDRSTMKYYYYHEENKERTWFKPTVPEGATATKTKAIAAREPKGKNKSRAHRLRKVLWDSDTFKYRIQQAIDTAGRDERNLMKVLEEMCDSNNGLLGKCLSVPETCYVSYSECMKALQDRTVEDYGMEPQVSFSYRTTADALRHFALQDRRRVVCGLNFAHGSKPGRNYLDGGIGQEEDLCRRIPALHQSLINAEEKGKQEGKEGLYPFGPCTCQSPEQRAKYCDVLFTPNLVLARGHESDGFAILPEDQQAVVSIVSASPPDLIKAAEYSDQQLLCGTVSSIFVAPVFKEPRCTTLVVGAWGCAAGNPPAMIANLFAQALVGELKDLGIRLGKLYHEIHFAIPQAEKGPPSAEGTEEIAQVFRQVLGSNKYRIRFVDM